MAYKFKVDYFPKSSGDKFGYVVVSPNRNTKVDYILCVFHGIGERGNGSLGDLHKLVAWGGWNVNENDTSLFNATDRFNFKIVMVQTDSSFEKGEIEVAFDIAYNISGVPMDINAMGISLGGFGLLNEVPKIMSRGNVWTFENILLLMPGGNGSAGKDFAKCVVDTDTDCMFIHAIDDDRALVMQSIKINNEIKALGGSSELVLYSSGGHNIGSRPLNAFYPWPMVNDTTYKVEKSSYIPSKSIYQWFKEGYDSVVDPPVVEDKLLFVQGIWQRPDGSVYAGQLVDSFKDVQP